MQTAMQCNCRHDAAARRWKALARRQRRELHRPPVWKVEGIKDIAALLEKVWRRDVAPARAWGYTKSGYDPLPVMHEGRYLCAWGHVVIAWAQRQPMWRVER